MYGLRSGRLLASVPQLKNSNAVKTETAESEPQVFTPPIIKQEPETLLSPPLIQSPYFHETHGGLAAHAMVGGGALEDMEDFSFDAGYVISSKLSQMVANGTYSYPTHSQSPCHSSHHVPSQIHSNQQANICAATAPQQHSSCHTPEHNIAIHIKTEPGSCEHPLTHNHTVRIKTEPGIQPPYANTPDHSSVVVKMEPGVDVCPQDHTNEKLVVVKKEFRGSSSKGKLSVKTEDGEEHWEPPLWRLQYQNICQMRADRLAPVDTHGCFMLAEKDVPSHVRRYQVLVSLMLSSQTKDQITGKAMTNLKRHGLTVNNILKTPRENIAKMINAVGFWQKKSEYIKRTTEILATKYNGDIPNTLKDLMSLPGVGPKMANLVMDFAWGQVTGIAVDTHVHRIAHRLGWMKKQTPNPEATRISLEKWLPMSEWSNLNLMLVGFGQTLCSPQRPHCEDCLNRNLCPSSLACSDATMGGLAGNFSPEALTTGKKKKKSKSITPITGENPLGVESAVMTTPGTPSRKKRRLNKKNETE